MNFSETVQTLDVSRFRVPQVLIISSTLVIALWCIWFFVAEVPLYETSDSATIIERNNTLQVIVPIPAIIAADDIENGQTAKVYFAGISNGDDDFFEAMVASVADEIINGERDVTLIFDSESLPDTIQPGLTARVEILTDEVSPAMLVFRTLR